MLRKKLLLIILSFILLIVGCEESKDPLSTPEPEPYKWYCEASGWEGECPNEWFNEDLYSGTWDTQAECEEAKCEETVVVTWEYCPMGMSDCYTGCTLEEIIGTCAPDTNGVNPIY